MAEAEALASIEDFAEVAAGPERGLWSDAYRRLIRNRLAMAGLIVLSVLAVLAIAGNTIDWVQRYDPTFQDYSLVKTGPSWDHFFGTDNLGRDNWSRVLEGLLISLQVGFGVQAVVLTIGILVGGTAALTGRLGDNILMRVTDLTYAFPDLLLIILSPVIVAVTFGIPIAIFAEAVLAFIGFGLPPPTASLGTLVNTGYQYIIETEWMLGFPACAIPLLMLCFTFIGDGLRDALDPRSR